MSIYAVILLNILKSRLKRNLHRTKENNRKPRIIMLTVKAFASENACFSGAAILNNCDVSQLTYETNESSLCESNRKSNRNTSQLFKMAAHAKFESEKIIQLFRYKHFFEENCRANLIANLVFFDLKLFISRSGGSLKSQLQTSYLCVPLTLLFS